MQSKTQPDLKTISTLLSNPPFNKSVSVIALHDEYSHPQLIALLNDIIIVIEQENPVSPHNVDLRNELPEITAVRMTDYLLNAVHYKETISKLILDGSDRFFILHLIFFLVNDFENHKKTAYLSRFLNPVPVPTDFSTEDGNVTLISHGFLNFLDLSHSTWMIVDLTNQLKIAQEEFQKLHEYANEKKQASRQTNDLKKEIQQLEEEKQMVTKKVELLKRKTQDMPNLNKLLEAARNLRLEQQTQVDLQTKLKEQKTILHQAEQKLSVVQQKLKDAKAASSISPETLIQKLREEVRTNKYLSEEKLPKDIKEYKQRLSILQKIVTEPTISLSDIQSLESQIQDLNNQIAKLTQKRLMNNTTEDKLSLFKQQAVIIANKKETTANRLNEMTSTVAELTKQLELKNKQLQGSSTDLKILKGDELKKYIADLRTKSNVYKKKKAELGELTTEYGILQRTREILQARATSLRSDIEKLEEKSGIAGYHVTKETLEKISEQKSELDESKEITLNEISEIVGKLVTAINDKKSLLQPNINELRSLKTQYAELESTYNLKKTNYDSVMVGIETETTKLKSEVDNLEQEIENAKRKLVETRESEGIVDTEMDRVLQEMKAYIHSHDPTLESNQKAKGYKSLREMYTRRIAELEMEIRVLKEREKEIMATHEPNLAQLEQFNQLCELLKMKVQLNQKQIAGYEKGKSEIGIWNGGSGEVTWF
ncbi:hypothetical protein BKA69DRAFT_1028786 [Paraphysoderma sedebokerense]|nr:hypothetical protein BKA69DRAFT_1028786 [Paraphysoderma sedebokerense]